MAFHTYNIVGVLMANEQFKFSSAIRAVVLVQGHRRFPPMNGKCFVITNIVVPYLDYVKVHFLSLLAGGKVDNPTAPGPCGFEKVAASGRNVDSYIPGSPPGLE